MFTAENEDISNIYIYLLARKRLITLVVYRFCETSSGTIKVSDNKKATQSNEP